MKNQILYSQSWEDPLILSKALNINKYDSILSITSSGDNTLYLLTKSPKEIIAIDINPFQNYLLELKVGAIKGLNYTKYLEFIGVTKSTNRIERYNKTIKKYLSKDALYYWDRNLRKIKKGIIHCGKFERYLSKFRNFVLPLSQSRRKIENFLNCRSVNEQKEFYREHWNNFIWRFTFRIFFSEKILKTGRKDSFFKYNKRESLSTHYLKKVKYGLTGIPINRNYFLYYILKGHYNSNNLPDYIEKNNFNKIKSNIRRLKIVTSSLNKFLIYSKSNRFSKFNLSDVFEVMPKEEYGRVLKGIVRTSKNNARISYWNNLVERNSHPKLNKVLKYKKRLSKSLIKEDRVFFYNDFLVESINK